MHTKALDYEKMLSDSCFAGFVQFDVKKGSIRENLAAVERGLAALKPQGPGIVVLPELWACGFDYRNLTDLARQTPALLDRLAEFARTYGVYIVGSLPAAASGKDGTFYNAMYFTGPTGVVGSYRKQQLFAPMHEDRFFIPGNNPCPVKTTIGVIGGAICYDLRFSDIARSQTAQGAGLLTVSAQWPRLRKEHWRTLLQARAIENQIFVVGCNRCGSTDELEFAGHSMIVAPDGSVLVEAGEGEIATGAALDPAGLQKARARFNTVGVKPYRFNDADKIVDLETICEKVRLYKALGRKVVFTNGCFDILHPGHVTYLEAARREGDCLIVGLNSDASVKRLGKGDDRPINNERSRARVLAALGCVDHVVLFDDDTPYQLITAIMPGVLVKGGDWPVDKIVGAPEVLADGGLVKSIPLVEDFSTTSLIEKIQKPRQE